MPMLDVKYPGVAYGQAQMTEPGQPGQLVRMSGHDQLVLNADPSLRSFGVLYKAAVPGELCTVFTDGGIYETDNFTGPINPGDRLKLDPANKVLTGGTIGATDKVAGEAISVQNGILRFKLTV